MVIVYMTFYKQSFSSILRKCPAWSWKFVRVHPGRSPHPDPREKDQPPPPPLFRVVTEQIGEGDHAR
jgi:hypothetical protein